MAWAALFVSFIVTAICIIIVVRRQDKQEARIATVEAVIGGGLAAHLRSQASPRSAGPGDGPMLVRRDLGAAEAEALRRHLRGRS